MDISLKGRLFQKFEEQLNRQKCQEEKDQQQAKTPAEKKQKVDLFFIDSYSDE